MGKAERRRNKRRREREAQREGEAAGETAAAAAPGEEAKRGSEPSELQRFLRTPRGQMVLLLAVLLVSVPIGAAVGLNRALFERYVREKYPAGTQAALEAAAAIARGEASVASVTSLSALDREALYRVWMRQEPEVAGPVDGPRGDQLPPKPQGPLLRAEVVGPLLFRADPRGYARLLKRTLVAGTPAQRERALELARRGPPHPALLEVLEFAAQRAERTRDPQRALLEEVLSGVATLSSAS